MAQRTGTRSAPIAAATRVLRSQETVHGGSSQGDFAFPSPSATTQHGVGSSSAPDQGLRSPADNARMHDIFQRLDSGGLRKLQIHVPKDFDRRVDIVRDIVRYGGEVQSNLSRAQVALVDDAKPKSAKRVIDEAHGDTSIVTKHWLFDSIIKARMQDWSRERYKPAIWTTFQDVVEASDRPASNTNTTSSPLRSGNRRIRTEYSAKEENLIVRLLTILPEPWHVQTTGRLLHPALDRHSLDSISTHLGKNIEGNKGYSVKARFHRKRLRSEEREQLRAELCEQLPELTTFLNGGSREGVREVARGGARERGGMEVEVDTSSAISQDARLSPDGLLRLEDGEEAGLSNVLGKHGIGSSDTLTIDDAFVEMHNVIKERSRQAAEVLSNSNRTTPRPSQAPRSSISLVTSVAKPSVQTDPAEEELAAEADSHSKQSERKFSQKHKEILVEKLMGWLQSKFKLSMSSQDSNVGYLQVSQGLAEPPQGLFAEMAFEVSCHSALEWQRHFEKPQNKDTYMTLAMEALEVQLGKERGETEEQSKGDEGEKREAVAAERGKEVDGTPFCNSVIKVKVEEDEVEAAIVSKQNGGRTVTCVVDELQDDASADGSDSRSRMDTADQAALLFNAKSSEEENNVDDDEEEEEEGKEAVVRRNRRQTESQLSVRESRGKALVHVSVSPPRFKSPFWLANEDKQHYTAQKRRRIAPRQRYGDEGQEGVRGIPKRAHLPQNKQNGWQDVTSDDCRKIMQFFFPPEFRKKKLSEKYERTVDWIEKALAIVDGDFERVEALLRTLQ